MATENSVISGGVQVYFVDASLPGYQGLMSGLGEGSKVFVIENTSDAFAQMDAALRSLTDPVAALHVYSHGREGAIFLGGQWIDEAALTNGKANTLSSIGNYLTEDGDILLYGCYTGAGVVGESFMAQLARLTRADVAASNNLTGLGGDWVLENRTGPIESGFTKPSDWLGMLAPGGDTRSGMGVIEGTVLDDALTGFVTNDIFYGKGGQDSLKGLDGNDAYVISGDGTAGTLVIEAANEGIDTVYSRVNNFDLSASGYATSVSVTGSAVEYIVLESVAGMSAQHAKGNNYSQTLVGNALSNNLVGGGGHDVLYGYDGDDFLDGGSGEQSLAAGEVNERNTLIGGKGNDNYIVRSKLDQVVENANEGTDHVYSFVDYALGNNLENLTLLDSGSAVKSAVSATGNALNNVLAGNKESNYLDAGAGNDTLYGSKTGLATEIDTLVGGAGNDAYYVYSANDVIIEAAGAVGGTADSLFSTVDYDLNNAQNVEHLFLMGDSATVGTGSTIANRIVGNENLGSVLDGGMDAVADTLEGGYGNDVFHYRTNDVIKDLGGNNTVLAYTNINANLAAFSGAELKTIELQGSALNATARTNVATTLYGNDGSNSLVGSSMGDALYDRGSDVSGTVLGGGVDTLAGGLGSDKYYVSKSNTDIRDTVAATAGGGIDSVYVAGGVDFTLATGVENLYMAATTVAGQRGVGNALANVIDASAITSPGAGVILMGGANTIAGQGADTLIGGAGNDQIYSYHNYDVIDGGAGGTDVLYICYDVADSIRSASGFDWQTYLNGRQASVNNIASFVYVGATATTTGANSMVGVDIQAPSSLVTNLVGTDRNDTLRAYAGTGSILDGGKGADSMVGSTGNDVFYVDNAGDRVEGGGGSDTIRSSININLNTMNGGSAATGIGTVELLGNTALNVTAHTNVATTLIGNTGNNNLTGGTKDDVLDGGAGSASTAANVLIGGAGNDLYHIRTMGDKVVEVAGGGEDSIYSYGINISLSGANHANVEYVQNMDSTKGVSITGTNRAIGETLIGNAGNDTIDGRGRTGEGGGDSIDGGKGNDFIFYHGTEATVDGGAGIDTLFVKNSVSGASIGTNVKLDSFEVIQLESVTTGANAISINASVVGHSMTLIGNTAANSITGTAFDDAIYGGGGADTIRAGLGNDFVEIGFYASIIANTGMVSVDGGSVAGGGDADTLSFGTGNDRIVFSGGGGNDSLSITHYNSATATLEANTSKLIAKNFEFYTGGGGNDTLDASKSAIGMSMSGGLNNDSIIGSNYGDYILLDGGNDTVNLGTGKDVLALMDVTASTTVTVNGFNTHMDLVDNTLLSAGWSLLSRAQTSATVATFIWTNGTQRITMVMNNVIESDVDIGTPPPVTAVTVPAGETFDATTVNANSPWRITGEGNNTITGGDKNDTIIGGGGNNSIDGGAGNDSISVASLAVSSPATLATVFIDGEAGDDIISIGSIGDSVSANINGGAGNDSISIGNIDAGATVAINGGEGVDALHFSGTNMIALNVDDSAGVAIASHTGVTIEGFEYYKGTGELAFVGTSGTSLGVNVSMDANGVADYKNGKFEGFSFTGSDYADTFTVANGLSVALNINGGAGNDTISLGSIAGTGFEHFVNLLGDTGNDAISIGNIADSVQVYIDGGDGNDSISVGAISNSAFVEISGGAGNDTINVTSTSGAGVDIFGGEGDNRISVGAITNAGVDILVGAGNDTISVGNVSGLAAIEIRGNGGNDSISIGNVSDSATVNIGAGAGDDSISITTISGLSSVFIDGADGADTISIGAVIGDATAAELGDPNAEVTIDAGDGDDRISVGAVSDGAWVSIVGGAGSDTISLSGAIDKGAWVDIYGNEGNDNISLSGAVESEAWVIIGAGEGDDTINVTGAIDSAWVDIDGGEGNDVISLSGVLSDWADVIIDAGDGDDTISFTGTISNSDVDIYGGAGDDVISLTTFNATDSAGRNRPSVYIYGEDGDDSISIGTVSGITATVGIYGGAGNDTINIATFTGAEVVIDGGAGDDVISIGAIADGATVNINGGAGNDTIDARSSGTGSHTTAITLSGGLGNDVIYGSAHGDNIWLDGGNDTITLGVGADTLTMSVSAFGGSSTVNSFSTAADRIDDVALTGWTRNVSRSDGTATANATVTWTNGGNTVTIVLTGVGQGGINFTAQEANAVTVTVGGSFTANPLDVPWHITGLGNNIITGGDMADTIVGGGGDNSISGGAGNDSIVVGTGQNTVYGGNGDDIIKLGNVADSLEGHFHGGGGTDSLYFTGGAVAASVTPTDVWVTQIGAVSTGIIGVEHVEYFKADNGGALTFADPISGVGVSMSANGVADYGGTKFEGFTSFTGSAYADTFDFSAYTVGSGKSLYVNGGAGNDTISVGGATVSDGGKVVIYGDAVSVYDTLGGHTMNFGHDSVRVTTMGGASVWGGSHDYANIYGDVGSVFLAGNATKGVINFGNDTVNITNLTGYTRIYGDADTLTLNSDSNKPIDIHFGNDSFYIDKVNGADNTIYLDHAYTDGYTMGYPSLKPNLYGGDNSVHVNLVDRLGSLTIVQGVGKNTITVDKVEGLGAMLKVIENPEYPIEYANVMTPRITTVDVTSVLDGGAVSLYTGRDEGDSVHIGTFNSVGNLLAAAHTINIDSILRVGYLQTGASDYVNIGTLLNAGNVDINARHVTVGTWGGTTGVTFSHNPARIWLSSTGTVEDGHLATANVGSVTDSANMWILGATGSVGYEHRDSITVNTVNTSGTVIIEGWNGMWANTADTITVNTLQNGTLEIYADNKTSGLLTSGNQNNLLTVNSVQGGNLLMMGAAGNDTISVGAVSGISTVSVNGGAGNDILRVGSLTSGAVSLIGGVGNDLLIATVGGGGTVNLWGGDSVSMSAGADIFNLTYSGTGNASYVFKDFIAGADTATVDMAGNTGTRTLTKTGNNLVVTYNMGTGKTVTLTFEGLCSGATTADAAWATLQSSLNIVNGGSASDYRIYENVGEWGKETVGLAHLSTVQPNDKQSFSVSGSVMGPLVGNAGQVTGNVTTANDNFIVNRLQDGPTVSGGGLIGVNAGVYGDAVSVYDTLGGHTVNFGNDYMRVTTMGGWDGGGNYGNRAYANLYADIQSGTMNGNATSVGAINFGNDTVNITSLTGFSSIYGDVEGLTLNKNTNETVNIYFGDDSFYIDKVTGKENSVFLDYDYIIAPRDVDGSLRPNIAGGDNTIHVNRVSGDLAIYLGMGSNLITVDTVAPDAHGQMATFGVGNWAYPVFLNERLSYTMGASTIAVNTIGNDGRVTIDAYPNDSVHVGTLNGGLEVSNAHTLTIDTVDIDTAAQHWAYSGLTTRGVENVSIQSLLQSDKVGIGAANVTVGTWAAVGGGSMTSPNIWLGQSISSTECTAFVDSVVGNANMYIRGFTQKDSITVNSINTTGKVVIWGVSGGSSYPNTADTITVNTLKNGTLEICGGTENHNIGAQKDVLIVGSVLGGSLKMVGSIGNNTMTAQTVSGGQVSIFGGYHKNMAQTDGNDTITVGTISGAATSVYLEGDVGNDVYNLQANGMKATIAGTEITVTGGIANRQYSTDGEGGGLTNFANDGNDKVNLFGVTATGSSGTGVAALNTWTGLVFKKDASGNVLMSFNNGTGTNILTFEGVAGQDTLTFYSGQGTGQLFGGDVDLDQLYGFIVQNGNGFDDQQWHGMTFTGTGTYTASAVKT